MRRFLALACLAFSATMVAAPFAYATLPSTVEDGDSNREAIPGVHVIMRNAGHDVTATTDKQGNVVFKGLAPGDYEIDIDGKSLAKSLAKLVPATPEKKSDGGGFSIGVGGSLFGGGGHSGRSGGQGAGPAQGGGHGGSSSGGGGGMGVGLNIPLGGDKGDTGKLQPVNLLIAILLPAVQKDVQTGYTGKAESTDWLETHVSLPYCPDTKGDIRLGFTVPEGGGGDVKLAIITNTPIIITDVDN